MLKNRIITATIIAVMALTCVLLGGWFFHALVISGSILVGNEIMGSTTKTYTNRLIIIFPAVMYLFVVINIDLNIFPLLILILFVFNPKMTYKDVLTSFFHCSFTFLVTYAVYFIYSLNFQYLIYIALCTFGADIGGFFGGKFFGKHKLAPQLSPKKTIEGAIGGWLLGMMSSYIYALMIFKEKSTILLILSIILPLFSIIGDLAFSKIKRELNIKDFSNLLPGHGGLLDRIDAFTFTVLLFYVLINFKF